MDTRPTSVMEPRSYVDFLPEFDWVRLAESDTLLVHVPGFKKEQMMVKVDNYGNLQISGERPLDGNRWTRFRKDFSLPDDCNASEIRAKFGGDILYVILSKIVTQISAQDSPVQAQEPPTLSNATTEPKPGNGQDGGTIQNGGSRISEDPNDFTKEQPDRSMVDRVKDGERKAEEKEKIQANGDTSEEGVNEELTKEESNGDRKTLTSTRNMGRWPKNLKYGMGVVKLGLNKQRLLKISVVLFVGLTMYLTYKLRKSIKIDNN